jgi:AcrR family transcriptional regulator
MPKVIENLREKILAEADRQMREVGYGAMTIQSIAKACGVGVGTVYNYYSSKDEIVIACVAVAWMKRMDRICAVAQYSQTYDAVIHCIYDQILAFGVEHEYIFKDATAANSVDGAMFRYMWFLSAKLAEPLRKFCKSDADAQIIAEALLAWIRTGKSFEEVYSNIMKLF